VIAEMDLPVVSSGAETDVTITAVFEAQYTRLCRLAYLLTGDASRAEELVMEAFARSLASWRRRGPDEPGAYLRRAVVNMCRNRRRRAWLERRHARAEREEASEASEPVDHVWAAVRALPPRQRAAVVLRYWDDLPEVAIAAALGCSVGTVKSQLAKAKANLAAALQAEEAP
jgi:RNA polymerase sigma-70 factor (sigma-E family)